MAEIPDLDKNLDGLLIHSENFQALGLMQEKYKEQVKCIHIDPPYNTDTSGFAYKNSYRHSSWLAMMENRLASSIRLLCPRSSCMQCHIDENEYENLFQLFKLLTLENKGTIIWDKRNPVAGTKKNATQHEYVLCHSKGDIKLRSVKENAVKILKKAKSLIRKYGVEKARQRFKEWVTSQQQFAGGEKPYCYLDDDGRVYQQVHMGAPEQRSHKKFFVPLIHPVTQKACPVPSNGWSGTPKFMSTLVEDNLIVFGNDETIQPRRKYFLDKNIEGELSTMIYDGSKGKRDTEMLGLNFSYCHPVSMYKKLIYSVSNVNNISLTLDYFAGSGTTGHAVVNLNREDNGKRKYILVEMGNYFDTVLKPRMQKVVHSKDWKDGKPVSRDGISHAFKYIRLESYEDTLNNLGFDDEQAQARQEALNHSDNFRRDYMLKYWLDFETRGSPSLLNIDHLNNPTEYRLKLKKPGSDSYEEKTIDLVETFNWLVGLHVNHLDKWRNYKAIFKREPDRELPKDQDTRLILDGDLTETNDGKWGFRKVAGHICRTPGDMNNTDCVLVIWRKFTGNLEEDNLMLDEWFKKYYLSTQGSKLDMIYVNGSNNLLNLRQDGESWEVRLIEETFHQKMWDLKE